LATLTKQSRIGGQREEEEEEEEYAHFANGQIERPLGHNRRFYANIQSPNEQIRQVQVYFARRTNIVLCKQKQASEHCIQPARITTCIPFCISSRKIVGD
jgi:hypothetical protein